MKKIIMVCSIFVLLLALSVPTFAAEPATIQGWFKFNESAPYPTQSFAIYGDAHNSWGSQTVPAVYFSTDGTIDGQYGTYNWYKYRDKGIWASSSAREFFFTKTTISNYAYEYVLANAVSTGGTLTAPIPDCDGSSCPATDLNYDGVCDDCGRSLTMSIRPYPPVDGLWEKSVYPYGLLYMRNDNIPSLYFLDNPITTTDGVDFRFNGGNFVVYNLVDGAWTYERTGQGAVEFPDLDSGRILKVSHDVNFQGAILMNKDADFFPTPLWEMVEQVTQGAMTEEMPKMGGTMTILVACGVGLMACLVVLSLFGKRSLISLR